MNLVQPRPYTVSYDTDKYPFASIVRNILGVTKLNKIHESSQCDLLKRETDQSTNWHRLYYDNFQRFADLYIPFLTDFVKPCFGIESLIYQKIPTFRVHLVDNLGVGAWHRDHDYNHDDNEVNLWLPFTDAYCNNSIWIESSVGANDIKPYKVDYGEILVFNGATLLHGNHINDTPDTRVSVDFRIVEESNFRPTDKGSINMETKFNLGGYFAKI